MNTAYNGDETITVTKDKKTIVFTLREYLQLGEHGERTSSYILDTDIYDDKELIYSDTSEADGFFTFPELMIKMRDIYNTFAFLLLVYNGDISKIFDPIKDDSKAVYSLMKVVCPAPSFRRSIDVCGRVSPHPLCDGDSLRRAPQRSQVCDLNRPSEPIHRAVV